MKQEVVQSFEKLDSLFNRSWPNESLPLVSVCSWVYNQKDYIRESIQSIITQETNFPVEIILQDDASTDGTLEIIREYERNYPHLFRNIIFEENQYSQGKDITTTLLQKARGKYVALSHGDDYWNDPLKLQKQVDFLEANEDCNISFHNCKRVNEKNEFVDLIYNEKINDLYFKDLMNGDYTKTVTAVFKKVPHWDLSRIYDDTTLFLHILEKGGYAGYMDDIMACYRVHNGGIWSKKNALQKYKMCVSAEDFIEKLYKNSYPTLIKIRKIEFYKNYTISLGSDGFTLYSFKAFLKYLYLEKLWYTRFQTSVSFFKANLKFWLLNYNQKK